MRRFQTAKLSSRGQVVIPKAFRDALDLTSGDIMMVFCRGDELTFRKVETSDLPISLNGAVREAQGQVLRQVYGSMFQNER